MKLKEYLLEKHGTWAVDEIDEYEEQVTALYVEIDQLKKELKEKEIMLSLIQNSPTYRKQGEI